MRELCRDFPWWAGRSRIALFLVLAAVLWIIPISAQQKKFLTRYMQPDVPFPGGVTAVVQDTFGFIWIGTYGGLYRYDGQSTEEYSFHVGDSTSLPGAAVTFLHTAPDGALWVGGHHYLARLDRAKRQFIPYDLKDTSRSHFLPYLFMQKGEVNRLMLGYHFGFVQFQTTTGAVQRITLEKPAHREPMRQVDAAHVDSGNRIWIASGRQLHRYQLEERGVEAMKTIALDSLSGHRITALMEDREGRFWIGMGEDLLFSDPDKEHFESFKFIAGADHRILNITQDHQGRIWVIRENGLEVFPPSGDPVREIGFTAEAPNGLHPGNYYLAFHDRSGAHWVFNRAGEVAVITEKEVNFNFLSHEPENSNSLSEGIVFAIEEDSRGNLWIGTSKALNYWNTRTGEIKRYYPVPGGLPLKFIYSIEEGPDGAVWLGSRSEGLARLDTLTGKFTHYTADSSSAGLGSNQFLRDLYIDRRGRLWIARINGVSIYHPEQDSFTNIELFSGDPAVVHNHAFSVMEDRKGAFWVICANQLFKISPAGQLLKRYRTNLLSHNTYCLFELPEAGLILIGTQAEGIVSFDKQSESFDLFLNSEDGLPANSVYGILRDDDQQLWLSTGKGIVRYDLSTKKLETFSRQDGLLFEDFASGAFLKHSDEHLYFGSYELVYFHPEEMKKDLDAFQPPIRITGLKVFGEEKELAAPIYQSEKLTLTTRDNFFELSFAAFDFKAPEKIQFSYLLEGHDQTWSEPSKENFARYSNLPVGRYRFCVRGTNSSGWWSGREAELRIDIEPYFFWESRWFSPLAIFSVFGVVSFLFFNKHHRKVELLEIEKQREREQQRQKMENLRQAALGSSLEALRSQMNPHFLFNVLNSTNRFISQNDTLGANTLLANFGKLMRFMLEHSKKDFIRLEDELTFLNLYLQLEHRRFPSQFDYQIKVDPVLKHRSISLPSMIIQPFIENAIRHGLLRKKEKGNLLVQFEWNGKRLIIRIEDDGIGRKAAETVRSKNQLQKSRLGIENVRKRLDILNDLYEDHTTFTIGDKECQKREAPGTVVIIEVCPTRSQRKTIA